MDKVILYHGSTEIVRKPEYGKGKPHNDYGSGFYCTKHVELAKEWACEEKVDGFANRYELNTEGLSILDLSSEGFTVLNWLALLLKNRIVRLHTALSILGRDYLINNFLPDYENYDVIVGYRADDSYFSFARAFVLNVISVKQLGRAMRLGELGYQYVLKSRKAFNSLTFIDCEQADWKVYYQRRLKRDNEAKAAYLKELAEQDLDGIFMRDILREDIKNDDPRLL